MKDEKCLKKNLDEKVEETCDCVELDLDDVENVSGGSIKNIAFTKPCQISDNIQKNI